ncbi:MAG: hypothetical protein HYY96_15575 [Candidatus Tectomicrobia bacterium]|nr:hypothetical protein [Candidatus Tectomicrobia bacterium]
MFLDWMEWNTITGELGEIDIKTLDTLLRLSKEAGFIDSYPPVESMLFRGYWAKK